MHEIWDVKFTIFPCLSVRLPLRVTPLRVTPLRVTPLRVTPLRVTPHEWVKTLI